MGNTVTLNYGQVAVFQSSCYADFVAAGGDLISFSQKPKDNTAQNDGQTAERPIIIGANSNAPFAAAQPNVSVWEYYNLQALQTDWSFDGSNWNPVYYTMNPKFFAIGPKTRLRLYEGVNLTGKNYLIENKSENVMLLDCMQETKLHLLGSINSIAVSLADAHGLPIEAFNGKDVCNTICRLENKYFNFRNLAILTIVILLLVILSKKRKDIFCH